MVNVASYTCINCKQPCAESDLYCLHCGYILPHVVNQQETKLLTSQPNSHVDTQWGTGYFHHRARLYLNTINGNFSIPVPLHSASVIVGRNKGDGSPVDIDLTPYKAVELGVSRRHARIDRLRDSLQIIDLESANGTYLNNERIPPGIPRILRNRSMLQLGKLVLRVQFA